MGSQTTDNFSETLLWNQTGTGPKPSGKELSEVQNKDKGRGRQKKRKEMLTDLEKVT